MSPSRRCSERTLVGTATMILLALVCAGSLLAFPREGMAYPGMPGFKRCGAFDTGQLHIHVSAKHVSCRMAMKVQKEYWLAPESEKELVGPDEYNGYVRLRRFPGWRCTSGAGAGNCAKGRQDAFYSTFPEGNP
ncbi:MAG TPA: hypothetical protein VJ827_09640 [Rubrobacter sp.]|nr:hypothetical protein [Rubrobacter sp.]